jgi:hypothetical protein
VPKGCHSGWRKTWPATCLDDKRTIRRLSSLVTNEAARKETAGTEAGDTLYGDGGDPHNGKVEPAPCRLPLLDRRRTKPPARMPPRRKPPARRPAALWDSGTGYSCRAAGIIIAASGVSLDSTSHSRRKRSDPTGRAAQLASYRPASPPELHRFRLEPNRILTVITSSSCLASRVFALLRDPVSEVKMN